MAAAEKIRQNERSDRSVAVLIVTYESEFELDCCLASLEGAAPRSDVKVLAWDNGSTDRSVEKLQKAGVTVIQSKENVGFAAAVNALADMADTSFLFLLNPDAAPLPGAIDTLIDAAQERKDRHVFCGRTFFPDGRENQTSAWGAITPFSGAMAALGLSRLFHSSSLFNPEAMPDWDRTSDRSVDIATGCAVLVRTSTWRSLGGFDTRYWMYGEEADFQFRMVRSGKQRPWFVSDAKFLHDNGDETPESLTDDGQFLRIFAILRAKATLMRENWNGVARWLAPPILLLMAWRFRAMSFMKVPNANVRKRLWRKRRDWMQGYPEPDNASGAASRRQRMIRLFCSLLDPRAYIHGLRIINYYNFAHVVQRRQIDFGDAVEISPNATFNNGARIQIGSRTLIAARASLMAGGVHGWIRIGNDCMIGPGALLTAANYKGDPDGQHRKSGMREANVVLEDNVWIGAGTVILPGVKIGRGAIIGAGAVVTKNVKPGSVIVGAVTRQL